MSARLFLRRALVPLLTARSSTAGARGAATAGSAHVVLGAAAAALLLAGCAAGPAAAQQPAPVAAEVREVDAPAPVIFAVGSGEVQVTPDRAAVSLAVETRGATAAAAGRENARIARAVLDTLRALGVPTNDLGTAGYTVFPEQRYDQRTGRSSVVGYVARNTVRASLGRLELVGPAIDAALAKGANVVAGLDFSVSSADSARRAAITRAVAAARADAEAAARAAGGSLGALVELTVSPAMDRPAYPMAAMMARGAAAEAAPTPVEPGEQSVRASVQGRWRFVAGEGSGPR